MDFKIVLTSWVISRRDIEEFQQKLGAEVILAPSLTEDEIIAAAKDADVVATLMLPFSRRVIESLPRLRVIYNAGTGFDAIDLEAATEAGIAVAYPGDYCREEVADHAIALTLTLGRKICQINQVVRKSGWDSFERKAVRRVLPPMYQFRSQTVGIIGLGRIGQGIAARARGVGFRVLGHDPYLPDHVFEEMGIFKADLKELLANSDYVILQAAFTKGAHHLIGKEQLALMKPSACLINTARGSLVDQTALYKALKAGQIGGAALDVMEEELTGITEDHPLLTLDNVIITGHSAFYSEQSNLKYRERMFEAFASAMGGQCPDWIVNSEVRDEFNRRWHKPA